jgi:16S rRNA C1402 (ribose-2'-O) methylase RsmI
MPDMSGSGAVPAIADPGYAVVANTIPVVSVAPVATVWLAEMIVPSLE